MSLYFAELNRTDGVLAVHITNRYLDLTPVVQRAAESLGKQAIVIESGRDDRNAILPATWILISGRQEAFDDIDIKIAGTPLQGGNDLPLWRDDYSNLLRILKIE